MKILAILFYYCYRFLNTIRFLGLNNAIKIFFISGFKKSNMFLLLFNNKFYFRPKIDTGSYNRLTKSQYLLKGTVKQPIEIIIDAGSNIGSQALRFINLNSNLKKIICIEPDFTSSELCFKNLEKYNAIIYNNALSNISNKELIIKRTINSEMSKIIPNEESVVESNNEHKIKTINLNDIVKNENLEKIDFIKFDINGYEDEVFESNLEWLKITKCIGFNNADINETTYKIIEKFKLSVGEINIYNVDQMIFLTRKNINWVPTKGFMSSKTIGYLEKDERY